MGAGEDAADHGDPEVVAAIRRLQPRFSAALTSMLRDRRPGSRRRAALRGGAGWWRSPIGSRWRSRRSIGRLDGSSPAALGELRQRQVHRAVDVILAPLPGRPDIDEHRRGRRSDLLGDGAGRYPLDPLDQLLARRRVAAFRRRGSRRPCRSRSARAVSRLVLAPGLGDQDDRSFGVQDACRTRWRTNRRGRCSARRGCGRPRTLPGPACPAAALRRRPARAAARATAAAAHARARHRALAVRGS